MDDSRRYLKLHRKYIAKTIERAYRSIEKSRARFRAVGKKGSIRIK